MASRNEATPHSVSLVLAMQKFSLLCPILLILWTGALQAAGYTPREGDFVFQSVPMSDLTAAIEGATGSPYSHVGLVVAKSDGWYVREAVGPVMDTPLQEWVQRGRYGQAFDAFRLREPFRHYIPGLVRESETFLGRPYDTRYRLDDERIYCSELLYKAMLQASGRRLGSLQQLGDLNWRPYRATIERYEGGTAPLERLMITPRSLAEADELEKVHSGYP